MLCLATALSRRALSAILVFNALAMAGCAAAPPAPPPLSAAPTRADQPQPQPAPPEPPGRIIFLGFALGSNTKAFRNDVLLAEKLVASVDPNALRIKLTNTAKDASADWPQATLENIQLAMSKTAEVARAQDRVLLFIAGHGTPGVLNVTVEGKHRHPLTPQILSAALAPLAEKQVPTVVVLSACYSGAFVPALQHAHRAVLTATDARGTSFRCRYDGAHTPFAEALFAPDGGGPGGMSVASLMARAQKTLAAQEKRRRLAPSRPQIFVGAQAEGWATQPLSHWLTAP